jgi:predicted dehydrogenase
MPEKITAVCHEGKWHDIEVEDDVMIYAQYKNGATGTFITTTGDFPGTNRLEITLDKAKIICENSVLTITELSQCVSENIKGCCDGFTDIESKTYEVELDGRNEQHVEVMNKFAGAILRGEELTASGEEGINGLTISNAAFLSSWLGETVSLPIDEDLFYNMLQEKINNSTYKKTVQEKVNEDMSSTY